MKPAAPHSILSAADGRSVPLYLVSFDKDGNCTAPQTRDTVLAEAGRGGCTDIHIYSHGWNNVFQEALEHYTDFFTRYFHLRRQVNLPHDHYRPMLVGILWPSTAFLSEDEAGPRLAGASAPDMTPAGRDARFVLKELAEALEPEDARTLLSFLGRDERLSHDEALEVARVLLPIFQSEARDGEGIPQDVVPAKLVKSWEGTFGRRHDDANEGRAGVLKDDGPDSFSFRPARSAGALRFLDPRHILRTATVYLMKDRAGVVGARGVGPLLASLLAQSGARVHLAGHSFGAKVMLSALSLAGHPRRVRSLLLLQPAVNAFCFARQLQEIGGADGAYRPVLEKTEMPVFSTFSLRDVPLSRFFHLALRRDGDIGEIRPAAGPPSLFAALGGYGAGGMPEGESITLPIRSAPARYALDDPAIRLYMLDGSDGAINGHGDVRNAYTAWAMANLVSGGDLP